MNICRIIGGLSKSAIAGLFLGSVGFFASVQNLFAGDGSLYFYYHGQKREFSIDTSQIAVKAAALRGSPKIPSSADLSKLASQMGNSAFPSSAFKSFAPQGWALSDTSFAANVIPRGRGATDHDWVKAVLASALSSLSTDFASPVFRDNGNRPLLVTNRIILSFADGVDAAAQSRIIAALPNVQKSTKVKLGNKVHWIVETSIRNGVDVIDAANAIGASTSVVRFAEPEFVIQGSVSTTINGTYNAAWALYNYGTNPSISPITSGFDLNAYTAWGYEKGDGVVVAVLDEGVDMSNPYLPHVEGADFTGETLTGTAGGPNNSNDTHGTNVASCIAGINSNGYALGIAPGATIYSARVASATDSNGHITIYTGHISSAISAAAAAGAVITNSSFEYSATSSAMESAYSDSYSNEIVSTIPNPYSGAQNPGMLHFAASGNDSAAIMHEPADLPGVNAVGALEANGSLASFSNTAGAGQTMAFSAPGYQILVATATGLTSSPYLGIGDGTSFASPFCAGVAALILEQNPSLTPAAILAQMNQTATHLGTGVPNASFGYGMPNAGAALSSYMFQFFNTSELAHTYNSNPLTLGFYLNGSGSKQMLIRGVGPTLSSYSVSGVLSDPVLTVYDSTSSHNVVASNQGWGNASNASDIQSVAANVGAFALPSGSNDCSILTTLSGNAGYTAQVTSASSSDGNALAEIYDANPTNPSVKLGNVSTLSTMSSGGTTTAGIVIAGTGSHSVLIRAAGPTLFSSFSVYPVLAHPTLTLYHITSSGSTAIASNTGWGTASNASAIASAASAVGAFAFGSGSGDSAILTTLAPGLYTAVVTDTTSGDSGTVLIESYIGP